MTGVQTLFTFLLIVLASIGGLTVVNIARLGIHDLRAAHREKKQPEAIPTRHDRWVGDRARWDTDFYELDKRNENDENE